MNCLLDSRVAKGALAKGRSTSDGLLKVCRRAAALQLAADIDPGWNFAPTRLNVADDPTRHLKIREKAGSSFRGLFGQKALQSLHSVGLSRWAANWIRLFILASAFVTSNGFPLEPWLGLVTPYCGSVSCARGCISVDFGLCEMQPSVRSVLLLTLSGLLPPTLDFGLVVVRFAVRLFWISCSLHAVLLCLALVLVSLNQPKGHRNCRVGRTSLVWWILLACPLGSLVSAMEPCAATERQRAASRGGNQLRATRVARVKTLDSRKKLLEDFRCWLYEVHGVFLSQLLVNKPPDAEEVCKWLILYGQDMYVSGKACGKFAETINSVATARPILKRHLGPAWDLAFSWLVDEPFSHHPALPLSVGQRLQQS